MRCKSCGQVNENGSSFLIPTPGLSCIYRWREREEQTPSRTAANNSGGVTCANYPARRQQHNTAKRVSCWQSANRRAAPTEVAFLWEIDRFNRREMSETSPRGRCLKVVETQTEKKSDLVFTVLNIFRFWSLMHEKVANVDKSQTLVNWDGNKLPQVCRRGRFCLRLHMKRPTLHQLSYRFISPSQQFCLIDSREKLSRLEETADLALCLHPSQQPSCFLPDQSCGWRFKPGVGSGNKDESQWIWNTAVILNSSAVKLCLSLLHCRGFLFILGWMNTYCTAQYWDILPSICPSTPFAHHVRLSLAVCLSVSPADSMQRLFMETNVTHAASSDSSVPGLCAAYTSLTYAQPTNTRTHTVSTSNGRHTNDWQTSTLCVFCHDNVKDKNLQNTTKLLENL